MSEGEGWSSGDMRREGIGEGGGGQENGRGKKYGEEEGRMKRGEKYNIQRKEKKEGLN